MVKKIIIEPGRTFSEFSLMPGHTKKDCVMNDVSLKSDFGKLKLKIPLISAAMTSVTGYELALALGKEGGLGVLPSRLSTEEQVEIVKKIKSYDMSFVEEPLTIRDNTSIESALKLIEKHGHSKIPVVDRNNVFLGLFTLQNYWDSDALIHDPVTTAMLKVSQVSCCKNPNISIKDAKKLLESMNATNLFILDEQNRIVKIAFKKDVAKINVASAISTHKGWEKRVKDNIKAGVDLIVIDTSDAYNDFVKKVLQDYKKIEDKVPICAGNIITEEGALFLMENGADMVKVGMSSGSICITQREKAVGRSPMTALIEAGKARDEFFKKTKKYVPVIMDGGITSPADMIIALTIADAIMMGGYFNKFLEAAGEKLDENGKVTRIETEMKRVATWGEGSGRAQNLDRYSQSKKTFFEEGVEGTVEFKGRLKPTLKKDLMKIQAALSNAGCKDLKEFRENSIIELISPHSSMIISNPHSVSEKK